MTAEVWLDEEEIPLAWMDVTEQAAGWFDVLYLTLPEISSVQPPTRPAATRAAMVWPVMTWAAGRKPEP